MMQDFNLFGDNTLCVTITLAEYRELIQGQALAGQEAQRLCTELEAYNRAQDELLEQIHTLQCHIMQDEDPGE